MKNIYLIILSSLAVSLAACGTPELETETVERAWSAAYAEGSQDSLQMEITLEWPVKGLPPVAMQNIQKELTAAIFGKEHATTDISLAVSEYCDSEADKFRKSVGNFIRMSGKDMEGAGRFSWSEMTEGRFIEPYENMQSYRLYTYGYTGGAHGIDTEKGLTFRLSDGHRITEVDLFKREYKPALSRILSAHLPQAVSQETYDMLFIKAIEPNENFYIDPEGITYIYGRYEIGPYVSGIVHVTIPWEELRDILR